MHQRRPVLLAVVFCLLGFASAAFAQSTGEVTGTVADANGAILPAAELRLKNIGTGVSVATSANDEGLYRFTNLQPGAYQLSATKTGFAPALINNVTVEVNRTARVDVSLKAGAVQEAINISAGGQLLDVESGTKGQIINSRQIEDLPLPTKNPLALILITPGVNSLGGGAAANRPGSDGAAITSAYTINGGVRNAVGGYNEFVVDAISVTNRRDGTVLALPGVDNLQEFRVQSGGMSAEFGHTVGGVVNYVTKGGTNAIHGNLFENHRSTVTNARRAIPANASKPANVYNQFGGAVGGPVYIPKLYDGRNKTFFFFGYDGIRWVRNNPVVSTVPTAKMRNGDFSELSTPIFDPASSATPAQRTRFAGNQIPAARFNSFGKKIVDLYPQPNLPGTANNFQGVFRVLTPIDNYTGRVDHVFNERNRVFFKFTRVDSVSDQIREIGQNDQLSQFVSFPSRNYTANYNFVISPTLVYNASAGYTTFYRISTDRFGNSVGASFFGHTITPAPAGIGNAVPTATFELYRGLGLGAVENQPAENFQINQSASWLLGKHTLRFGADLRRYHAGGFITNGAPNGNFGFNSLQTGNGAGGTGDSIASALLGLANSFVLQQPPRVRLSNNAAAVYVMDDLKMTNNLTINLGLRLDLEGRVTEMHNRIGYFDSRAVNPIVNRPGVYRYAGVNELRTVTDGDHNNFGPRIGFAYAPGKERKLVIRGAFGIYYSPIPSVGYLTVAPGFESTFNPVRPNATAPAIVLTNSYSLPAASGPLGDAAFLGQGMTQPLDKRINNPSVYQWNFGFQRELWNKVLVEALYSGNRGLRLLSNQNINLVPESLIRQAIAAQAASGRPGDAQAFLNRAVPNPLAGLVPGTLGAATVTIANASLPFPQFTAVNGLLGNRDSNYHSLQVKAEKRLSGDLSMLLAYTFSKGIDNAVNVNYNGNERPNAGNWQNVYDLRDARGVSSYDRTHIFAGSVVYALPFGKGKRYADSGWLSHLAGGFQLTSILSAQSGWPLAITQSAANGISGAPRPDVIADPKQLSEAIRGTVNANGTVQWINSKAYASVNGRFGTAPIRDSRLRGPEFWQLDIGLQRDFHITERVYFRFRAESFNALNHTNLAVPEQNINSPAFGQIAAVYDPRIFQFGLQLKF